LRSISIASGVGTIVTSSIKENVKEEERELYECFKSEKEDRREVEEEEEGSGVYYRYYRPD
jgi:hypothetical protein